MWTTHCYKILFRYHTDIGKIILDRYTLTLYLLKIKTTIILLLSSFVHEVVVEGAWSLRDHRSSWRGTPSPRRETWWTPAQGQVRGCVLVDEAGLEVDHGRLSEGSCMAEEDAICRYYLDNVRDIPGAQKTLQNCFQDQWNALSHSLLAPENRTSGKIIVFSAIS